MLNILKEAAEDGTFGEFNVEVSSIIGARPANTSTKSKDGGTSTPITHNGMISSYLILIVTYRVFLSKIIQTIYLIHMHSARVKALINIGQLVCKILENLRR